MCLLVMAHMDPESHTPESHRLGDHAFCDPDVCITAKLRYWRDGGGAPLKFTYGKETFSGPTIRERQAKIEADAAAAGKSVRLVNPRYDR